MKAAKLFPEDDIHDSADDWKDQAGPDAGPYHNGTRTCRAAAKSVRPCVNEDHQTCQAEGMAEAVSEPAEYAGNRTGGTFSPAGRHGMDGKQPVGCSEALSAIAR